MPDNSGEFSNEVEAFNFVEPFESGLVALAGPQAADQLRIPYHKGVLDYLHFLDATEGQDELATKIVYMDFLNRVEEGFQEKFHGVDPTIAGVVSNAVGETIARSIEETRQAGKTDDEIREFSILRIEEAQLRQRLTDMSTGHEPYKEATPDIIEVAAGHNRLRKVIAPLAALAIVAGGLAATGVFSGKRSRTDQAQALAQNFAARINGVALEDADNTSDKVTTVEDGYPVITELTVEDPDYKLTVDYANASSINTAPQNVASVEIDYFPKSHSDNNAQYKFWLFDKAASGLPGWSINKYGSFDGPTANQSGADSTTSSPTSFYNSTVKTAQFQRNDQQIVLVPLTSTKFAALEGEANRVLQHIETDATDLY